MITQISNAASRKLTALQSKVVLSMAQHEVASADGYCKKSPNAVISMDLPLSASLTVCFDTRWCEVCLQTVCFIDVAK